MTAAQPQSLDRLGVRSLEVRWILRGQLAGAVEDWFGRFPAEAMALEDAYLLHPRLPGLSVKVRGGRALDVKVYGGSPGLLEVAGRARGRLESWQKWSFPHGPASPVSGDLAGWRLVRKRRRISFFAQATGMGIPQLGEQPGCAVELTAVDLRGEPWWTLCFEATGPADALRCELDAAAAFVFAEALPGGVQLGIDDSQSYVQWLCRQPGTG
jgi:hypothetical protein